MIFGRRKHKLPKFPPSIRQIFYSLCEPLPVEDVATYHAEVDQALAQIVEDAKKNSLIHVSMARSIAECCHGLLEVYPQFSRAQQSLIVGAIRYFAEGQDALSEAQFASGFDDDAKILNYVMEELGIQDRFIELR